MMDFDWKKTLAAVAPGLAAVLTGGNPLSAVAVKLALDAMGVDGETEDDLAQAVTVAKANPKELLKLKIADQKFAEVLLKLGNDDRADARSMQVSTGSWVPGVMGTGVIILFFGYVGAVTFLPGESVDRETVNLVLGWIGGMATTVMAYYFGSSKGQDNQIAAHKS